MTSSRCCWRPLISDACIARSGSSRRACAASIATPQLAMRDRTLSARLVRMMGTRAPSTRPALSALARNVSCFARMFPASRSGASRMSGSPATGDAIPLIRAASALIALSNASGPSRSAVTDLPALRHLAQRRRVERRLHLRGDGLDRREDRDLRPREPERDAQVDRVLADVDLVLQHGRDVDRRVRDQQDLVIRRHIHDEHVADAPPGPQPRVARDHGREQFVRVQTPLHQQLRLALPHELHGLRGRGLAVRRVDDAGLPEGEAGLRGDLRDLLRRADENGRDQSLLGGFERAGERRLFAGMRHRRGHRLQAAAALQQAFVLPASGVSIWHAWRHAPLAGAFGRAAGPVSFKRSVRTTARPTPWRSGMNAVW